MDDRRKVNMPDEQKSDLEAELIQRKERTESAAKAIHKICEQERVSIQVTGFNLIDGRLFPRIEVVPL